MAETTTEHTLHRIRIVAELTTAYTSHNHVRAAQLPELIASIHLALDQIAQAPAVEEAVLEPGPATAAQIRKSVTHDALISFIDGRPYKTLKRHLTKHALTPETYRARYGLPDNYPMTSPSYSVRRSILAKGIGLGNHVHRRREA